jgi:hypothetical protein
MIEPAVSASSHIDVNPVIVYWYTVSVSWTYTCIPNLLRPEEIPSLFNVSVFGNE